MILITNYIFLMDINSKIKCQHENLRTKLNALFSTKKNNFKLIKWNL